MRIVNMLKHKDPVPCIIMAIDASSTSIAVSIFDQQKDCTYLRETAKIRLNNLHMNVKLRIISDFFPILFSKYDVDYVFVEQPIYIQNPATSRVLSQISGHVLGTCINFCSNVSEVPIANWKSFIGYKNVSKADKDRWNIEFGEKEAKKMAASERKQRTIRIVHEKISGIDYVVDNDICDAIGIGLYGLDFVNRGASDGS